MTILGLIIAVLVLGAAAYLFEKYVVPAMPAPFGRLIMALVALLVIVWLLGLVGVLPSLNTPVKFG